MHMQRDAECVSQTIVRPVFHAPQAKVGWSIAP